jgi:hypothetical protein
VKWKSFDGRENFGILVSATGGEIHRQAAGAGGNSRRTGRAIATGVSGPRNYYLNELGIALIYPNVRGSTAMEKHFHCWTTAFSDRTPTKTSTPCLIGSAGKIDLDASRICVTAAATAAT